MDNLDRVIDLMGRERRQTNADVISSFDEDPEKAVEAVNLGKDTGTPPVLIHSDLDNYKRQLKTSLVSQTLESNAYLRDIMSSDPMMPKLAHDDIGQLDNLTSNVSKMWNSISLAHPLFAGQRVGSGIARLINGGPTPWERGFVQTVTQQNPELVAEFLEGHSQMVSGTFQRDMRAGAGSLRELAAMSPEEYKRKQESLWEVGGPLDFLTWSLETVGSAFGSAAMPFIGGGIGATVGIPGGVPGMVVGGAVGGGATSYVMNYGEVHQALIKAGASPEVAHWFAAPAGAIMAGLDLTGIGVIASRFVLSAAKKEVANTIATRVAKEAAIGGAAEGLTEGAQEIVKDAFVSWATDKGFMTKENAKGWVESALAGFIGGAATTGAAPFASPASKAKPYIDAGKDPPAGLDPTIDQVKLGQNENDVQRLVQLLNDAEQSQLRERSPEHLSSLLERQLGETSIEVPAEAVFKLYGTKPVTSDDGLLGWIPDLEEQMRGAHPAGGNVSINVRDWLAYVTKDVQNALLDDIVTRPSGLSKNDGKIVEAQTQAAFDVYHGTPHFFDVFSTAFPRTGEGAQTYGWGLYFGQARGTAETYVQPREYRGKTMGEVRALEALRLNPSSREAAMAALDADSNRFEKGTAIYREIRNAINLIKKGWQPPAPAKPQLLKTRIHSELEEFLDLDKLLSEQTPAIRAILAELGAVEGPQDLGEFAGQKMEGAPETGETFRRRLEIKLGGPKEASEALAAAGIPGSKYLDQFSRDQYELQRLGERAQVERNFIEAYTEMGDETKRVEAEQALARIETEIAAKQPTYNIVLFDPTLAEIVERNGEVIASTRQAASLGVLTDLGPQAEWMLYQNRLRMQAILDRLQQAKTPEEIAALRQEVRELPQTLRAEAQAVAGQRRPGWKTTPVAGKVDIIYGATVVEARPIGTNSLKDVLNQLNLKPLVPFGQELQPIIDRVIVLAANTDVHVVSDSDYDRLLRKAGAKPTTAAFHTSGTYATGEHLSQIVIPLRNFQGKFASKYLFHEAIHAATQEAIFKQPALGKVIDGLMLELKTNNPELTSLYGFKDAHEFLAEAISNQDFQEYLAAIELTEGMAKALGMEEWRGKTLWTGVVEFIRNALGIPEGSFTALEAALRVTELAMTAQEGVLVRREGATPKTQAAKAQLELDVTRQEDLKLFEEARSVGLTADQYIKMMDAITKQTTEDAAYLLKKIMAFVKKKQTKEWKAEEVNVKSEVEDALLNRPDIALATFFRTGRLYGIQQGIPKINASLLTTEQKKLIPKRWQGAWGMDPQDAAMIVGYSSVDQMALRAALLEEQMVAAKQPSLRKYVDGLVKAETERRMVKEFGGTLEENILAEAQDHVVSPTQMDLLHEDTVAMGMQNGWTMPFTKAEIVAGVKATFGGMRAVKVSMEKFLRDAGKAGKLSGIAGYIEKNGIEFFKQRQAQEYALRFAGEAKALTKELTSFERTVELMGRRESVSVDEVHFAYAQDLLTKAGLPVKNSPDEIARTLDYHGHGTLDEYIAFMQGTQGDLELFVPRGYAPKQFDQMTVDEFREFKEAIDGIRSVGIRLQQVNVAGDLRDFNDWKQGIIDKFKQRPIREVPEGKGYWLWRIDAPWTRMEEIVKDLDLREELGALWQILIHGHARSKTDEFDMLKALKERMEGIKKSGGKAWQKTLDDDIPQDFIHDRWNGVPFKLNRWNLIRMMLNVGNESNKGKLARGIASAQLDRIATGEETQPIMDKIDALINKHATKEDWDFVSEIWKIFREFREREEQTVRATAGKLPKWIESGPVYTAFGEIEGGYFPLIADPSRPIKQDKEIPEVDPAALMGPNYRRAATSRPHHLDRTGAVYFVDITNGIENIAGRMQQHIHDIAYREFVMDAGKVIYDKEIMFHIKRHYGKEYADQMEPWLQRIANPLTVDEKELQWFNDVLRFFRLNLTVAAIPLNYAVMFSPTIGTANVRVAGQLAAETPANRKRILDQSEELKHVLYTIDRDLTEQLTDITGGKGPYAKWTSFQRRAAELMLTPLVKVEQQTRSVTFYGEYMGQKAKGRSDAEAASWADSIVRERHGAVSPGDLPAILAKNSEWRKVATVFLGWFTMNRNWMRQIPEQIRQGDYSGLARTVWGTVIITALFNAALFTKRRESDSIWSYLSRALMDVPLAGIPFIRDVYGYATEGRRPGSPMVSWGIAAFDLLKDGYKAAVRGEKIKRPIRRLANVIGQGLGVPGAVQGGRTTEFLVDQETGQQKPRDAIEFLRGLFQGEARLKK